MLLLACATLSRTQTDTLGPPGLHLCCNLPLQLNAPPFLRITEILVFVGLCNTFNDLDGHPWAPGSPLCATLSRTSAHHAGLPGLHSCCNLPIDFNIPPFPRNGAILVSVGLQDPLRTSTTTPGPPTLFQEICDSIKDSAPWLSCSRRKMLLLPVHPSNPRPF